MMHRQRRTAFGVRQRRNASGVPEENYRSIKMDLREQYAHLREHYTIHDLLSLMAFLRSPAGCAWDRAQTHASLIPSMLEEAYEVVDAIGSGRPERLCDELGDVLMQVVFHADLASEAGHFDFDAVVSGICRKLIERHTHVFGTDQAQSPEEVHVMWERNKRKEKDLRSTAAALREVTRSLPALTRSEKVQKKAAIVGFDWADADGAADKITEELAEVREVAGPPRAGETAAQDASGTQGCTREQRLEEEIGDLLFSVVNYARKLGVQSELALDRACEKFIHRFTVMETAVRAQGLDLQAMSLAEMDRWWDRAKAAGRADPLEPQEKKNHAN